jgi:hypothetical protein
LPAHKSAQDNLEWTASLTIGVAKELFLRAADKVAGAQVKDS